VCFTTRCVAGVDAEDGVQVLLRLGSAVPLAASPALGVSF
jgi:hypothetical protein